MESVSPHLSIISPVYQAENIVLELVNQIECAILECGIKSYEIILVEDRSPDESWNKIETICNSNSKVKGIKMSANTGQHNAITCGLDYANGNNIIVMDCDLQHDPKEFKRFFQSQRDNNVDIVYGIHKKRNHSFLKNVWAKLFYWVYDKLSESKMKEFNGELSGFVLITNKVKNELVKIREQGSHFLLNLSLIGFNHSTIEIKHNTRFEGSSSYNFTSLIRHALNGITANSTKLLRTSIYVGAIMISMSIIFTLITLYQYIFHNILEGFTSLIAIIVFLSGANMLVLGIIGLYLGKTFEQVKNRPLYHVDIVIN